MGPKKPPPKKDAKKGGDGEEILDPTVILQNYQNVIY